MRVLIAVSDIQTSIQTIIPTSIQTSSAHDRTGAIDGELVAPVVLDCPDPLCDACRCNWFGLASHRPTLTAMVVDRPHLTVADLGRRVHELLDCDGTIGLIVDSVEAGEYEIAGQPVDDPVIAVAELVEAHLAEIVEICTAFPVGTVLSRLGQLVAPRAEAIAA